jgi:hypothetical protein
MLTLTRYRIRDIDFIIIYYEYQKFINNKNFTHMRIMNRLVPLFCTGLMVLVFTGCKKQDVTEIPPLEAHFTNLTGGSYQLTAPGVLFKIPVGITTSQKEPVTINFTVSSPTGAVAGTHYNIVGGTTVVIPVGKTVDSITVAGVFAQYTAGRKDTLVFTMNDGTGKASAYNNVYKLLLRGPCFEGDVNIVEFLGQYRNTNEVFGTSPYGPYVTSISSAVSTGPTTGRIVVQNIWDNGWGPITFDLDWTNPANRTATVVAQNAVPGSNAGDINGAYSGITVAVRPFSGQPGTFSICNNTLTLRMQLGVTGVGFFGSLYTVAMAR